MLTYFHHKRSVKRELLYILVKKSFAHEDFTGSLHIKKKLLQCYSITSHHFIVLGLLQLIKVRLTGN